jgi:hypothetical protein
MLLACVDINSSKEQLTVAERRRLAELVSEQELKECYQLYLQLFGPEADKDIPCPIMTDEVDGHRLGNSSFWQLGDLGVEEESKMSRADIMQSLGFSGQDVTPWSLSISNAQPYDVWAANMTADEASATRRSIDALAREGKPLPPGWVKLQMKDHQLDCLHAVTRLLTTDGPKQGVLVADEVGVGKTAAALGVIMTMIHYRQQIIDLENSQATVGVAVDAVNAPAKSPQLAGLAGTLLSIRKAFILLLLIYYLLKRKADSMVELIPFPMGHT